MNPIPLRWQIPVAPWLSWALNEFAANIKETPGRGFTKRILDYFSFVNIQANDDEIPWCSAAMNCAMAECGLRGTGDALARSWEHWGVELQEFRLGAIAVFWRDTPDSTKGHVAIALCEDKNYVTVVGGNQNDSFNIAKYPKSQLIGYRWPENFSIYEYYVMEN